MEGRVALCVDELTCSNPRLIGLDGELLDSQGWLSVFLSAEDARLAISADERIREVWVVSCDDVEPINLAATLKADRPELAVRLVAAEKCGSLCSRAHTARIDEVLELPAFLRRYADAKAAAAQYALTDEGAPSRVRAGAHAKPSQMGLAQGLSVFVSTDAVEEWSQGAQTAPVDEDAAAGMRSRGAQTAPIGEETVAEQTENAISGGTQSGVSACAPAPAEALPETARVPRTLAASGSVAPKALAQPEFLALAARPRGFVMPIVSGSGGAGKSTVAVVAAFTASRMGYRTLLVDYDLQFGDVAEMAGVEGPLALDVALAHPEQLERELQANRNPTVLAAPARLEAAEEAAQGAPALIDSLAGAFDVIVANTGAAWADYHAALLERSSAALFIVDQRASSLRACRHALELCARCGIATGAFQFAINRCRKGASLTSMDVSCSLQGVLVQELQDGGPEVEEYLGAGAAQELLDTGNALCLSVEALLKQVLPDAGLRSVERMAAPAERRGFGRRGRASGRKRGRKS